jgi:hypothetical protein
MTVNRIAAGAAVCCAALFVSACGGGTSAGAGATGAPTTATPGSAGGGAASGARGFPGATGLLAQIDGTTLQVQGTDTQTAVTYSAKTTFTNTVAAKLSNVVVGVCVQARSASSASGTGGTGSTAAPSATAGTLVAVSVEISPAVNGSCSTVGGLRRGGTRSFGATGERTRPAGTPDPGRTQGPGEGANRAGGNGFGGLGAFGKVTAVGGAGFTVESSRPQTSTANTAVPTTAVPSTPVPTTQTVKTSSATTYTRTEAATAKALAVGLCVTAMGKADDTGSIAATSITLRSAQNGSCSSGFGGRGPGGRQTSTGGGSGA